MSEDHCAPATAAVIPRGAISIALAGNPNVGKTTLFNALTGMSAKVSNYPGITVERRTGLVTLPIGPGELHDLPGTYSLNARSHEEQIAFDAIVGLNDEKAPDVTVVCLDATQLARSVYLLMQIRELGTRVVGALTMVDEAGTSAPDARALGTLLGCEVVAVTARTKRGISDLLAAIDRCARTQRAPVWQWTPSATLRAHLDAIRTVMPADWTTARRYGVALDPKAEDALLLWALTCIDNNPHDGDELQHVPPDVRTAVVAREFTLDEEAILARWAWLDREIPKLGTAKPDRSLTEKIDRVLLHRALGFGIFTAVMALLFMALFTGAAPLMDGIAFIFKSFGNAIHRVLGDGIFTDLLVDGVIAGVGSVLVFLPQILMLFLFLGFLEDCGYLARVAYLMDRVMRSMNLHGKAFVPMLFGFACAVPAISATRTMERRRDRLLTMMVVPMMTCSARLPVYTLIIAALIPGSRLTQAGLMVGMYAFSVTTSLVAAWVMSKTVKPLKAKRLPFIIELPPYRFPRLPDVLRMMWGKSSMFLREAGSVILACSIALWALLYFPRDLPNGSPDYQALIAAAPDRVAKDQLTATENAAHLEASFGGRLGHAIEPVIAPLGFDWKIGVGLIGAFAAREVFVSTLGIVYAVGGGDDDDKQVELLRTKLHDAKQADGKRAYSPLVGFSLMVFFALAMQCMSTLAVVRRESGGLRWPIFLFSYMTILAYLMSFIVYQGGRLLGFS